MNVIRWEPFREVDEMFRQYSPLFTRALRRNGGEAGEWTPVADISETDQEYLIKAQLPEVKKEDVKVTLDNGIMLAGNEAAFRSFFADYFPRLYRFAMNRMMPSWFTKIGRAHV